MPRKKLRGAAALPLTQLTCLRCGHSWFPRRPQPPKVCPKCVSPYWDREKERLTVHGRPKVKVSKKPRTRKR